VLVTSRAHRKRLELRINRAKRAPAFSTLAGPLKDYLENPLLAGSVRPLAEHLNYLPINDSTMVPAGADEEGILMKKSE